MNHWEGTAPWSAAALESSLLCGFFLLLLLLPAQLLAQVEEEDLDVDASVIAPEVERLFADAEALFSTVDQADSIPLFRQVIEALTPLASSGEPSIDERLRASYLYSAQARHNFGNGDAARLDLDQLIRLAPAFEIDRDAVSPKLAKLFDESRQQLIGFVEFLIAPADTEVEVGDQIFRPQQGPQIILAGSYLARASRPGFSPASFAFEVTAGETATVGGELERSSAVLILRTRPNGATVLIDGVERGRTTGQAESSFISRGDAASHPRSDFSSLVMIDEIAPGTHRIEVHKDGFRPYRRRLEVGEARDIRLQPVLLEREVGTVVLHGMPADARVMVDGQTVRPQRAGSAASQLTLAPGSYQLRVSDGTKGIFETAVDVTDRGAVDLQVELRPALVLLGILGSDDVGSQTLRDGIFDEFRRQGSWTLLDRSMAAAPLLRDQKLDVSHLRSIARGASPLRSLAWPEIQGLIDRELPGAVYLLGVLSDDLLATSADLWIWPAAPGPSTPEFRRVSLEDSSAIAALANAFVPSIGRIQPTLGLRFFDSGLVDGPVVASVEAAGPAENAGVKIGDQITALAGVPILSSSQLVEELRKGAAGRLVEIELKSAGGLRKVEATTGRSYSVVDLASPDVVYSAVSAALTAELERASEWPRWVLQLNQAGILLHSGDFEGAVRQLRRIEVSTVPPLEQPGLGRAHLEYWLGLALTRAGARYSDRAREAFSRAATAQGGRLYSDEGPLIAPRARARLERLGAGATP